MLNSQSTPEFYGYKIGDNIAPYINRCIDLTGECYISEGTHIIGRNDKEWWNGNIWSDNIIQWGWTRKHGVKIIGVGYDKTTLKFIDNVQSCYLLDKPHDYVLMLQTNYNESCDDNVIQGITFDGNYQNNSTSSTLFGIRIRGNNNKIDSCRFINFGVGGLQKHECFVISLGPVKEDGRGSTVSNCLFSKIGNKKNSPNGYVPETTLVSIGGSFPVVENNIFEDCYYDINNQQSPIHGVSFGQSNGAVARNNVFKNFQGKCFYTDSWHVSNAKYTNNSAVNVWSFIHLSCQKWKNPEQITFYKNIIVEGNEVSLSNGYTYHQWNLHGYPSSFFSYIYDPSLNYEVYKGFENVIIKNNQVMLGYLKENDTYKESFKLVCSFGSPVDSKKINLEKSNSFVSTIPIDQKKKNIFKKIINWFKQWLK